jgi:hypothetical protein
MVREPAQGSSLRTDHAEPEDLYSFGRLCFRYNRDRIEADGAEPDRVERGRGDERGKDLYQPQSRRRCWSGSGTVQFCKGAA